MKINNLKKYSALFGLTSLVLLNGCTYNNSVIKVNEKILKKENSDLLINRLNYLDANYNYEDKYITENNLNLFVITDKYEKECGVTLITDDMDNLVRGLIPRIEKFSKYVSENITTSSHLYVIENYDDPYGYSDKTFYKILYDVLVKVFENEDKENWHNLYCKLANMAIVFSNDHILDDYRTSQTQYVDIRDIEFEEPLYGAVIIIDEENIDKLSLKSYNYHSESNYEDIYMNLFYDALCHEIEHCCQNNCSCYYSDYRYLNHVARLINLENVAIRAEFLSETGAVINGNKYHETEEFLNNHKLYTGYEEEIETTKLLESAILLRSDYSVSDIYDNSVSSNPKKLCAWFNVDIIKIKDKVYYGDYEKLLNMLVVLNATNSSNQKVFDWIVDKQYGSTNNMNAKKMLLRSDAVIDLMLYSYKNLIKFNEENNLSKEAFKYLFNCYQNYYLSESEFVNGFDNRSYWSDEFKFKFTSSKNLMNDYIDMKYKSSELVDIQSELKNKLGDKYYVFMTNIASCDNTVKERYNNSEKKLDDIANVNVKIKTK